MNALKLWRHWAEAAIVIVAVTAVMTAPWIVADTFGVTPAGLLLIGFTSFMAGGSLAVGTVALDQIARDARRAARR